MGSDDRWTGIIRVVVRESVIVVTLIFLGGLVWVSLLADEFVLRPGLPIHEPFETLLVVWLYAFWLGYPCYLLVRAGGWIFRRVRRRKERPLQRP